MRPPSKVPFHRPSAPSPPRLSPPGAARATTNGGERRCWRRKRRRGGEEVAKRTNGGEKAVLAAKRTNGGESGEKDEWRRRERQRMEWLPVCVYVYVYVHWYLRLCVCVLVLVDVVCSPNARPSPNSWQPRGCGAVAPVVAVLWLLSLLVLFCCCHVFARSVAPVAAGALFVTGFLLVFCGSCCCHGSVLAGFALDAAVLWLLLLPWLFSRRLFARSVAPVAAVALPALLFWLCSSVAPVAAVALFSLALLVLWLLLLPLLFCRWLCSFCTHTHSLTYECSRKDKK